MKIESAVERSRERGAGAGRRATRSRDVDWRSVATSELWDEQQVALADDLAALMNGGLIAAVSDGPETRYAVSDGGEVLA